VSLLYTKIVIMIHLGIFSLSNLFFICYLTWMNFDTHLLRFLLYPLAGIFVGSITNFIAIKLLFHPKRKYLGVQGLLPKRKSQIAERAGEIVNSYLVNSEEIRKQINREKLKQAIDRFLDNYNNPVLKVPALRTMVKTIIVSMLTDKDGYFSKRIIESIIHQNMVSEIVEKKINEFDVNELELLVKKASNRELNFIIVSGGILGFIIGIVEAFIGF